MDHPTIPQTSHGLTGKLHTPDSTAAACLIRIYPPSIGEGFISLPASAFMIGRDAECALVLEGKDVSRHHAVIGFDEKKRAYRVRDLGSLNGTQVNDKRVAEQVLLPGDLVRVGKNIFKFLGSDDIERQYHEAIYTMTITDGLTGAANKRCLLDALERELFRSSRHARPLSLAMLDLDHFKRVNDTHGHLAGDAVLRELCARIRAVVRRDELLARFGGEEFVVVLPESTLEKALKFAERIRQAVAASPVEVEAVEIPVTVSIGVATTTGDEGITSRDLLARADAKLYEAKNAGRNRVMG